MYIVNAGPGFKFLWPAAQKFLDAKTIAKIHVRFCSIYFCPLLLSTSLAVFNRLTHILFNLQVLDPKSLGKLLEAIDPW